MKFRTLIVIGLVTFSFYGNAQEKKAVPGSSNIYTPLKPSNGHAYVFGSKNELETKGQEKKGVIIEEIKANANDPKKVKALREKLWRIENATVANSKNSNK